MRLLKPCGTLGASSRHYRHGEPLDEACRQARNAWQRNRRRCETCGYRTIKCQCISHHNLDNNRTEGKQP